MLEILILIVVFVFPFMALNEGYKARERIKELEKRVEELEKKQDAK